MGALPLNASATDQETTLYLREMHPMILRIARRIQDGLPQANHFDDMVQAGVVAAWENRDHYLRWSRPDEFIRWLAVRVRGAMMDLLRDEDPLPRRLRAKARHVEHAMAACRTRLMRTPTDAELAEETGMTMDDLHRHFIDVGCAAPDYLGDYLGSGNGEPVDEARLPPDLMAAKVEVQETLARAIADLPEQERTAISLYILEGLTLEEVGQVMGFAGKSQALRLVNAAIFSCRSHLAERHLSADHF
ncbi:MAG: sigma-70 family RNA polymerase sigma factor [Acidithiobacillus sp.]